MTCKVRTEDNRKMYYIETHERINKIVKIFQLFGMWGNEDEFSFFPVMVWKLLYLAIELSFALSLISGGFLSDDKNERVYLIAVGTGVLVLVVKLYYILWKNEKIHVFIREIGAHSVADYDEFSKTNKKVENLMKFSSSLFSLVFVCSVALLIFSLPIFHSKKRLPLTIWFPLDWKNNTIAHWIAYVYISIGIAITFILILFNAIIWFLMMNCAVKYEMLGNQFRKIGSAKLTVLKMSNAEIENFYHQELIGLIKTYQDIQETVGRFKFCFASLFFAKILTSAICICGTVFALAFSAHGENLVLVAIEVALQVAIMFYHIFDILMATFLGNEIKLSSDRLSYCLFESNWIERSQSYKKYVIIMTEVFKQPQELLIGKVYPMNLKTFTSIVNAAYSMFNILQKLH